MFKLLWLFAVSSLVCLWIEAFNLDVDHAILVGKPSNEDERSYFGYSVVLYGEGQSKWLKVGAPRGIFKNLSTRSGLVYHCPYMETCYVDQRFNYSANLADSWIGGAMDINYKHKLLGVSASRYQKKKYDSTITGALFIENIPEANLKSLYSPFQSHLYQDSYRYNAMALGGFSIHFPQESDELLAGAPGVFNFVGSVFRIRNLAKAGQNWTYQELNAVGNFYEHSGYAVTSGNFFRGKQLYYASGLPKGFQDDALTRVLSGSVSIFTFNSPKPKSKLHEVEPKITEVLVGNQFGEHFGASLTAGDLDGDGLDDLIVGAPFRCNDERGYNHGSVYVYYGTSQKALANSRQARLDGTASGGQFGLTLMLLGDLDRDGLNELAISAPNENEGTGTVYIYSYDNLSRSLTLSQRISGRDVDSSLKGFGISFSRTFDIDDNGFVDLAVGSAISGHAVILRTKPTVTVFTRIRAPKSFSKSNTTFTFQCCYFFTGYKQTNLTLTRNVTVDREFYRFHFKNRKTNIDEKHIQLDGGREHCEVVHLVKMSSRNYKDPIAIELTYALSSGSSENYEKNVVIINGKVNNGSKDSFCKNCPVLSKKSSAKDSHLVIWDHNCEHDGRMRPCLADLVVKAQFLHLKNYNTFVVGSGELLNLQINLTNHGDPAYLPSLTIQVPQGANYVFGPADCQSTSVQTVTCKGQDVLYNNVTHLLKFSVNSDDNSSNLTFLVNASTVTDYVTQRSSLNLTLNLRREADLYLTSFSKESIYVYGQTNSTVIQNTFKLEKFGPSPTPPVKLEVIFPYKLKSLHNGFFKQFVKVLPNQYISSLTDNPLVICNQEPSTFKRKIAHQANRNKTTGSRTLNLNCALENVACALIVCSISVFENVHQTHAEVSLEFELDLENLSEGYGKGLSQIDQITLDIQGLVSIKGFNQSGNRSDFTELSNLILTYKDGEISFWILIGSAIIGLFFLICVIVVLGKVGFFERKEHQWLLQLKEEALKEEKLIEEMIEKELQSAEPFQGDPVFRSDFTELSNLILTYKDGEISFWILIGSAIIGLFFLICVIVVLGKVGFFERKEHQWLLQLKEEALKEEKLIEEMIEKELQSAEPFQGDPVFRYIKPEDLHTCWNNLQKTDLESSNELLREEGDFKID